MNQLSLNVIALTVFTFTLSSLLGPVIHLPPAIPAIAAFAILALMTLDTLQWQGLGSLLVLEGLASLLPANRDRRLHHEAGHFLVAYLLHIPIISYTLNPWEAWQGGQPGQVGVIVDQGLLSSKVNPALWLDRYYQVGMAGEAAEILVYGKAEGGASDRQLLQALSERSPEFGITDGTIKQRWAQLQAQSLIKHHWGPYQALVLAMKHRRSVAECIEMIEQQKSTAILPINFPES